MQGMPEVVKCPKCGHLLDPSVYGGSPEPDTPPEEITRYYEPKHPTFSLQCTCGHYIVSSPFRSRRDSPKSG